MQIPDGDLLLYAGDMTGRGDWDALKDFNDWLGTLPHEEKIAICGNHDFCFEWDNELSRKAMTNCIYLQEESTVVNGLKIYGAPHQPWFYDWAFNVQRGEELAKIWAKIPEDTDVLITHGPPFGYGDKVRSGERVGCEDLMKRIEVVQPKLHVFGHIHEDRGQWEKTWDSGKTTKFVNAASLNLSYQLQGTVYTEIEL
jgi:Icc-related predicted phosphoesterase